jgi:transcriptional regulator with XRE-family HTH domain
MERHTASVHGAHMATKSRPQWRRTFLRQWREHRNLTLESVSEKMGISHGQLSRIERGLSPYSQHVLEVAAAEYGCTVQDLLTRQPDEAEDLISLVGQLNPQQRRRAARLIDALREED